ncbi:MAG: serine/threonine protein kinase [Planctomycetota bacterium]|jgi:serine/threonine-protein kinase
MADEKKRDGFGDVAVELRFITPAQLDQALAAQRALPEGSRKPIGEILVGLGLLDGEQVEYVLREQSRRRITRDHRIGQFEILEKVGQGGMGAVYRASDLNSGRHVALKILPPSLARDKRFLKRFHHEAQLASNLFDHENIVKGYGAGQAEGLYFFVMEYVDGVNIQQMLTSAGRFPEETALKIIQPITRALQHAHYHGLIHQDIKPENIIIDRKGTAKLLDLGLARRSGDLKTERLVTPLYVAPEQIRGDVPVDIRSDIYSLGVTFFHMVTGRPPFVGQDNQDTLSRHLEEGVPWPRDLVPELSEGVCQVIVRMLAKDPGERYSNPKELLYDLDCVIASRPPRFAIEGPEGDAAPASPAAAVGRAPAAAPPAPTPSRRRTSTSSGRRPETPEGRRRTRRSRPAPAQQGGLGPHVIALAFLGGGAVIALIYYLLMAG